MISPRTPIHTDLASRSRVRIMDEHKADIISNLPEEILLRIISFLPFGYAIQTIFLSKRWSNLWNRALVRHGTNEEISTVVSCFISDFTEHDSTKNTRKLLFHFGKENTLLAIIAPNNTLHLYFSSEASQEIPRNFAWCLELNSQDQNLTRHPNPSTFFVKSLYLISVNHLTNEAVSSLVSNFHFLENLKIISCTGLTSLRIDSRIKLLHLTIFDSSQLQFLEIKSFKLKTLRYRGFFPFFRLGHHFNLADALFDCRLGSNYSIFSSVDFDPVLLTFKNAEILTLCRWFFEALIFPCLCFLQADFLFYRLKELWWMDNWLKRDNINSLISFLKLCPLLERLFITIGPKTFNYSSARTIAFSKQVGEHIRLENLKLVKLDGLTSQEEEIRLVEALQETFTAQPLILSSFSDNNHILKLVKKSSQSDNSKWCHEVIEVKDTKDLCTKHPHMGL